MIKQLIYILLLISPLLMVAQGKDEKVETPQIITKLKVGKTIHFKTKSVRFLKVAQDSRCPSDVDCVWAGEAKIVIELYENDTLLEEKEISLEANTKTPTTAKKLFTAGEKTIYGYNLSPYPSNATSINPADYCLELVVK